MSEFIIDTTQNLVRPSGPVCRDPYDHLDAAEWVQKQIDYGQQEQNISGRGLVPALKELQGELVGVEIGVCHGFTTEYFLKNVPNIERLVGVDHYPSFVDWDGTRLTEERQEESKRRCAERLSQYGAVELVYDKSENFAKTLEDDSLDFVFVDGDHSYDATYKDFECYWPKVKKGGVFAGHDINLSSVDKAIKDFFKDKGVTQINVVENNAWYFVK